MKIYIQKNKYNIHVNRFAPINIINKLSTYIYIYIYHSKLHKCNNVYVDIYIIYVKYIFMCKMSHIYYIDFSTIYISIREYSYSGININNVMFLLLINDVI